MELKPLSLIISFRSNYAKKLNNDTQVLYWVLWDKWNYLRRPKEFNIDNNTLMIEAKLKNYSQLNDSRKKLIEAGLIKYVPSKTRGKSSTYALIKNYVENATPNLNQNLNETQELNNNANSYDLITENTNLKSNLTQNLNTNPIPNLKQNPNKSNRDIENNIYNNARDDNISPAESQVLIFYQNRICSNLGGTPGANEIACLREYAQVYGAEQTIQALKKALQSSRKLQGIYFVKYVGGILRGWANLKIAGGESNGQLQSSNLSRTATQAQRKTGTDINWAELD